MSFQNNIKLEKITAPAALPVNNKLSTAFIFSLIIALIMAAASAAGLIFPNTLYPTVEQQLSFVSSDAFNLAVGLPVLLGSMWIAHKGKLIGLLCWPGALFYTLYMYIPYLLGVSFNLFFLPYLILIALSASTLIGLVASIDGESVRRQLDTVPARVSAGILLGLALLIIARQSSLIFAALASHTPVETLEIPTWIADFTIAIPALLITGIQLWRRRPFGYAAGGGLFLGYSMLALSVIPIFVARSGHSALPIDIGGIASMLLMAVVCLVPFVFFVRGAAAGHLVLPSQPDAALDSKQLET